MFIIVRPPAIQSCRQCVCVCGGDAKVKCRSLDNECFARVVRESSPFFFVENTTIFVPYLVEHDIHTAKTYTDTRGSATFSVGREQFAGTFRLFVVEFGI
jgi:hypothetical protein